MAGRIPGGLAVAAGACLAMGLGLTFAGPSGRRRRAPPINPLSSDSILVLEPILDRLDRIETRLSSIEARPIPAIPSAAELDLTIRRHAKDIEMLQAQMTEARQREADGDIARLAALFAEVKHPLAVAQNAGTSVRRYWPVHFAPAKL